MFKSLRFALLSIALTGLAATVAVLSQALWSFGSLDDSARRAMVGKDVVADVLPPPMYLIELRLALSRVVEQSMTPEEALEEVRRLENAYQERVRYWTEHPPFGLDRHLLGTQHEAAKQLFAAARPEVLDKVKAGDIAGARVGLNRVHSLYVAHRSSVDETVNAASEFAERSIETFEATYNSGRWIMSLVTLTLLMATGMCYVRARRSILHPLQECVALAGAVAGGDLTRVVNTRRTDEIGALQRALGDMTAQLGGLVSEVRKGVGAIASASMQIVHGNDDLSARTQEQAATLEQTAASMEEMTATVKQNADNAREANSLAGGARVEAEKSGAVVQRTVAAMEEISASSRKIADIIGVIDEIAFQTNLLALNAAVEAARAGEQGRGFAVVATEVRNLAQRSAAAAKEIKDLIKDSVEKVKTGSQLVNESGGKLHEIVGSIKKVTDIIAEIAAASSEQATGIEQVNGAVTAMDTTTQQNAALVEEAAAASKLMQDRTQQLAVQLEFFHTRNDASIQIAAGQNCAAVVSMPRKSPVPSTSHSNTWIDSDHVRTA